MALQRCLVLIVVVILGIGCNTHRDIVIKSMRKWEDDSKKCSLLTGNPAIEGTPTPKEKVAAMYCYDDPSEPEDENWKYTYVGTVKLDEVAERNFNSSKWRVDVICTRTQVRTFECVSER